MPIRMFTSKKNTGLDQLDKMYEDLRYDLTHNQTDKRTAFHLKRFNYLIGNIIKGTVKLGE